MGLTGGGGKQGDGALRKVVVPSNQLGMGGWGEEEKRDERLGWGGRRMGNTLLVKVICSTKKKFWGKRGE